MELKWLDDYVALIETGSFSAAAERRHVSQPAFSRRIQMLEEWLGVTLIDRARKPLQFTPVAAENQAAFEAGLRASASSALRSSPSRSMWPI